MRLTEEDRAAVAAAVAQGEAQTDGEIVTIVAHESDRYHDVALNWAVLAMLLMLALLAAWPGIAEGAYARFAGGWDEAPSARALLTVALVLAALSFLLARLLLAWAPLRRALVPPAAAARRVRWRALLLFQTSVAQRTRAATGVLLYLSLQERRAEIVADQAIHSRVKPEVWGEAMAALVASVRDGRPGEGMAEAVARIGVVLHQHFPRSGDDTNELPDRVIEL